MVHLNDGKGIPLELAVLLNVSKTRPWDFTSAGNIIFLNFNTAYYIHITYQLKTQISFIPTTRYAMFIEYIIIH